MPHFAGVQLTPESISAARQWYADHWRALQRDAESGSKRVNDLASYRAWCERAAEQALDTEARPSFAMLQRAHFIQTGDSVGLLP
jgi:hypothetical protein